MTQNFDKQLAKLAVFAGALFMTDAAVAGVSFSSNANLSFSINNIVETGTGNAVDYSDLQIFGLMAREADPALAWTHIAGNGHINDAHQEIPYMEGPVAVGNYFNHSFNIDGVLNDGMIDFNQTAYYDVGFINNSALYSYDVTLSLSYGLSSEVSGQDGTVSAMMSFFDDSGAEIWADSVTGMNELAEASEMLDVPYTFTIGPGGELKTFYVDVNHNGRLEASPVPLPAAVWPFMTGLFGIVALRKRKLA